MSQSKENRPRPPKPTKGPSIPHAEEVETPPKSQENYPGTRNPEKQPPYVSEWESEPPKTQDEAHMPKKK